MNIELGKNINPREIETKIQEFWDTNNFWDNDVKSDKKPFCIMMPPPNVTGNLHGLIKSAARANNIQIGTELDFVVAQNVQG